MGIIQEYKCPACRKTWRLFVGHGMNHNTLDHVLEAFPANIRHKVLETEGSSKNLDSLFLFNYRPAVCRQCQDIVAIPVLRFPESGHLYISECPECGNTPELLEESVNAFCPKCLKQNLSYKETGHWD